MGAPEKKTHSTFHLGNRKTDWGGRRSAYEMSPNKGF
jgi:hypothetical protein